MTTSPKLEIHYGSGGCAALYVDGRLDSADDAYLIEEKAFAILEVKTVQSDDFLRGQDQREGVAQTLEEVAAWRDSREERERRVADLKAQAAVLLAEAEELGG